MAVFSGPEIKAYCLRAGFTDDSAELMAAIALAESGGNDHAIHLSPQEYSLGAYQINTYSWDISPACAKDMTCSSQYVYERISRKGTVFTDWTMYKNGGYKKYLPIGKAGTIGPPSTVGNTGPKLDGSGGILSGLDGPEFPDAATIKKAAVNLAIGGAAVVVALISLTALLAQSRAGKLAVSAATRGAL